ncbi:MAG: hypothetical protein WBZ36_01170 [Candidatus Nitrosopolaris sp.]
MTISGTRGSFGGERIEEIEEGRAFHYETKVLTNKEEIVDKITNFLKTSNDSLIGLFGIWWIAIRA